MGFAFAVQNLSLLMRWGRNWRPHQLWFDFFTTLKKAGMGMLTV